MNMRKIFLITSLILLAFTSCQESLEKRAARELSEYTKKNCPTPIVNDQRLDSTVYEESTRTLRYYYSLYNRVDNESLINEYKKNIRAAQLKALKNDTKLKAYKDAGFGFRYTYYSTKNPGKVLFDATFQKKDYQ